MRDAANGRKRRPERLANVWGGLLLLGVTLALAAACGGGGSGGGSDSGSPTPQATGAASPIASPGAATTAPCQKLIEAKTYRFVSKVSYESPETTETPSEDFPLPSPTLTRPFTGHFLFQYDVEASVVAPDRFAFTITTAGAPPFGIIVIGQETWVEFEGTWRPSAEPPSVPYQPIPVCQAIMPELDLSKVQPEPEEIDGVKTLHYRFPRNPSPEGVPKIFGTGSDMDLLINALDVDLWLSEEDSALVRLEFQGKGLYSDGRPLIVHLLLDVRDINDKDIKVEAPI